MAAMSIAKSTIVNLSTNPFLPLRPRVSRVCFVSASTHRKGDRTDAGKARDVMRESLEKSEGKSQEKKEKAAAVEDTTSDAVTNAAEKSEDSKDRAAESAYETKEKVKKKAREMNEKSKEKSGPVADKARRTRGKIMDSTSKMAEKTKEYAHGAKEKTGETLDSGAEKTKEKANGAAETVADVAQSIGKKAKQTVRSAWGAAKETTQKIKETVVGKSDDEYSVEDSVRKPEREVHKEKGVDMVPESRKGVGVQTDPAAPTVVSDNAELIRWDKQKERQADKAASSLALPPPPHWLCSAARPPSASVQCYPPRGPY
ncbi:hypothetical protein Salat_2071800 [Sesamum alatum]|uniref:Uncharacterized protein n=1 Tax=Sesamum alatum TaxID=300844 RepID=A0AAE1Y1A8_9LAMI|nr:hypothetical protein Salat_2071800 [Sesamum alatum]